MNIRAEFGRHWQITRCCDNLTCLSSHFTFSIVQGNWTCTNWSWWSNYPCAPISHNTMLLLLEIYWVVGFTAAFKPSMAFSRWVARHYETKLSMPPPPVVGGNSEHTVEILISFRLHHLTGSLSRRILILFSEHHLHNPTPLDQVPNSSRPRHDLLYPQLHGQLLLKLYRVMSLVQGVLQLLVQKQLKKKM